MRLDRLAFVFLALVPGCGFERPEDVPSQFQIGGDSDGMWDGAAITLRLESTGVNELLTVDGNDPFEFDTALDEGSSFTVTVETAPNAHDCEVIDGAAVLASADYDQVRIECIRPAVDVTLSAPVAWEFDPGLLEQGVDLSLLVQQIALTVTADDATTIRVGGTELPSGTGSAPLALPLGVSAVTIDVEVDTMSRSFELNIDRGARALEQDVYAKASNTGEGDAFGSAIAVSGDLLAVGAPGEDSSSTTINGAQNDEGAVDAGAAYVFRRTGSSWQQVAYVKPSNAGAGDGFGRSVALDGNTLVVGASAEDGPTNAVTDAGAAYVFVLDPGTGLWSQQAVLRPSDSGTNQRFGFAVAVSGDVVAAGINPDLGVAGAVYMFRRTGSTWAQEDRVQGSESAGTDGFGFDVSLEGGLFGATAPGITGGKAYVFRYSGSDWVEESVLRGGVPNDYFGRNIAVSQDRAVVGASWDNSDARGVNPAPTGGTASMSGAVYVYAKQSGTWSQEAFIKSSNSDADDWFGIDVTMIGDVMVVGSYFEDGGDPGVEGNQGDNSMNAAGAAYVFHRGATGWSQAFYAKSSNPGNGDTFSVVALASDRLVVGAVSEDSDATGVGGSQGDSTNAEGSGAMYLFR